MRRKIYQVVLGLVVAVAVFLAGGAIFGGVTARASEVAASGLQGNDATITDLNGNPISNGSSLDKWTSYSLSYKWAIKDGVPIAAGDTATVTLPEGAVAEHDTTVPLLDDTGHEVGTFVIKAGETSGTITFNDSLAGNGTNRSGTLQLYVKGTTNSNENNLNWGVNKVGWISGKDADGTPTELTWNIAFNPASNNVGTTTLTDTLGPNQTYIPGSVVAQTGSYSSDGTFSASGTITPEVSDNGNQLTFTFTNVTTAVNMTYKTKPTVNGSGSWDNSAAWEGKTVGSQIAWGGSGTGNGNGAVGEVILNKEDTTTANMLAGAVYRLQKADGTVVAASLTTDANGQIIYPDLPAGDYEFVEITAPTGYALDPTPKPFTIVAGQTTPVDVYASDMKDSEGSVTEPENPGNGGDGNVTEPENPGNGGDGNATGPENPGDGDGDGNLAGPEYPGDGGGGNVTSPENPGNGGDNNGNGEVPGVTPPTKPTEPQTPQEPQNPQEPQKPQNPNEPQTPTEPQKPTKPGTSTEPGESTTGQQTVPGSNGGSNMTGNGGAGATGSESGQAGTNGSTGSTGNSGAMGANGQSTNGQSASGKLPQTGEQHSNRMILIGLGLLVATLTVGILDRQRQ